MLVPTSQLRAILHLCHYHNESGSQSIPLRVSTTMLSLSSLSWRLSLATGTGMSGQHNLSKVFSFHLSLGYRVIVSFSNGAEVVRGCATGVDE